MQTDPWRESAPASSQPTMCPACANPPPPSSRSSKLKTVLSMGHILPESIPLITSGCFQDGGLSRAGHCAANTGEPPLPPAGGPPPNSCTLQPPTWPPAAAIFSGDTDTQCIGLRSTHAPCTQAQVVHSLLAFRSRGSGGRRWWQRKLLLACWTLQQTRWTPHCLSACASLTPLHPSPAPSDALSPSFRTAANTPYSGWRLC